MQYANYKRLSIEYDSQSHVFSCFDGKMGQFISNACIKIQYDGHEITLSSFAEITSRAVDLPEGRKLIVRYSLGPESLPNLNIDFLINKDSIEISATPKEVEAEIEGDLNWGTDPKSSTYAVSLKGTKNILRTAHGPAASKIDNALYDRMTDSVLEFTRRGGVRLGFDWAKECYNFRTIPSAGEADNGVEIKILDNYYAEKFSVPFRPINKGHQFETPPAGWMTWYSVQFDASNVTVLENARWLAENLKDYGANCIWVDWEWYHSDFTGKESPGVDTFNPRKDRYPNGLKYISDEIRELGLIPALWIGATNDTNKNRMLQENPDWILATQPEWCGEWWIDPSNPGVIGEYIPTIFNQLLDWGYEAFKWDCLPVSLNIFDQYHDRFYDKGQSSEEAFRNVVKTAREVIGTKRYMMSCSGNVTRDITFAADYFDGARVGQDIFKWDEFVGQCIDRAFKYYVYHNVLWYADMDNVVLRSEFNSMAQAFSRISFYALTGVPVTMGDYLPDLEAARVELLKRALPVVDIHPMDIHEIERDAPYILVNLSVAKSFGSWNVIDVMNPEGDTMDIQIELDADLHLDNENGETYAVYDFWGKHFLGICKESIELSLRPYNTKVFTLTKLTGYPQVVSTSRHITQGAYDIDQLHWDGERCLLSGNSRIVAGEAYAIVVYVPRGYDLVRVTADGDLEVAFSDNGDGTWAVSLASDENREAAWKIQFASPGI